MTIVSYRCSIDHRIKTVCLSEHYVQCSDCNKKYLKLKHDGVLDLFQEMIRTALFTSKAEQILHDKLKSGMEVVDFVGALVQIREEGAKSILKVNQAVKGLSQQQRQLCYEIIRCGFI